MDAVVIPEPGHVEVRRIAKPRPGAFEALVRIETCGLCGTTDRHIVEGTQAHHPKDQYPAVLGHESVGTVVEVGERVTSFKPGDRVTRAASIFPGEQRDDVYSAWGGFAEYGLVRDVTALVASGREDLRDDWVGSRQIIAPEGLDPLDAALAISLSEIASWTWKLGALGAQSMVIGGTGLAGCAMCVFARLAGATPIIAMGRRDDRLELMRQLGADETINSREQDVPEAVRALTHGVGAAWFAEATGVDEVFVTGLRCLAPGGTAAIYGAPVGYRYTLAMKGAPGDFAVRLVCPEEHRSYARVCSLLMSGAIDATLFRTHVWDGLDQLPTALEQQAAGAVVKGFVRIG
ncbi:MAG: sorbitol dehydrogenase [Phycisphaeraceae bacterium]|nr:sorbitol dehydrogenase [Phycisphaeraceae bacterium]